MASLLRCIYNEPEKRPDFLESMLEAKSKHVSVAIEPPGGHGGQRRRRWGRGRRHREAIVFYRHWLSGGADIGHPEKYVGIPTNVPL